MKKYQIRMVFVLLLLILSGGVVEASEFNFSVNPLIPKNQWDTNQTYFDLMVEPGLKQTLTVRLRNDTEREVVVLTTIQTATTNLNGVVEYGASDNAPDETIAYLMEDILTTPDAEITIPARGTRDLTLELAMPQTPFDGILVGGIAFQEKVETLEDTTSEANLAIENRFAYNVAVVLRETETVISPDLLLTQVAPGQVNARNVINATIQNPQPMFINQLAVTAEITKKGKDKVLFASEQEGMQMAPNTSFAYPISLEGEKLKPGKYTLNLTATSKGDTWTFTQDFEITSDEAKDLNEADVSLQPTPLPWGHIATGGTTIAMLAWVCKKLYDKEQEVKRLRQIKDEQSKED